MFKTNKKVSIIIPTYKRAKYIERAINSILQQTYKNIEIIIVDDNNPNTEDRMNMQKIMKKYKNDSRIIYLMHDKNRNGAAARNTGLRKAKGEYVTFLDDDDYFLKNRIEILVNELEKNREYNAAFSGVIFTTNGKITKKLEAKKINCGEKALLNQESFFGTGSNMFLRMETVQQVGEFDETFLRNQDFEFMVRYFSKGNKILAVNDFLVVKTNDNIINIPNIEKTMEIRKKYLDKFKKNIEKFDKKEIYANNYLDILHMSIQKREWKSYRKIKKEIEKYRNITIKEKIYNIMLFFNGVYIVKLLRKPYKIYRYKKLIKSIDTKVLNEIDRIENTEKR